MRYEHWEVVFGLEPGYFGSAIAQVVVGLSGVESAVADMVVAAFEDFVRMFAAVAVAAVQGFVRVVAAAVEVVAALQDFVPVLAAAVDVVGMTVADLAEWVAVLAVVQAGFVDNSMAAAHS